MRFDSVSERLLLADAATGNQHAIRSLLAMHTPFVISLSKRFYTANWLEEELVQAGYTGILLAVRRFDPSCGTRFLTYAYPWIVGEMKRAMRERLCDEKTVSLDSVINEEGQTLMELVAGEKDIDINRIDLMSALSRLPHDEKLLITLRYFRDKSQKETACLMKKSQAQISRMERKALDRLGTMLSET